MKGEGLVKIELLDEKTVKVLLSRIDMNNYHLTYDEMDYRSPDTKKVLLRLLDEVKRQIKIDLSSGKLFIEAFPYVDGGCILYVNLLDPSATRETAKTAKRNIHSFSNAEFPLIITITGVKRLGALCSSLTSHCHSLILDSELFLSNNSTDSYSLLLHTGLLLNDELVHVANEFLCSYKKGAIAAAHVREHGCSLIEKNAVPLLDKSLN